MTESEPLTCSRAIDISASAADSVVQCQDAAAIMATIPVGVRMLSKSAEMTEPAGSQGASYAEGAKR